MDRRNLRCGDWVKDPQNHDYVLEADENVIKCANMFAPVELTERFFEINGFKNVTLKGEDVSFRIEDEIAVTVRKEDGKWRIEILTGSSKYNAKLLFVHELQHALLDCFVDWKIIAR